VTDAKRATAEKTFSVAVTPYSGTFNITVVAETGAGTFSFLYEHSARYGETVELKGTALGGGTFAGWQAVTPPSLRISGNSFTMPESDVVIKAVYR
jgi:hypothetical protein